jgi:hypothetical protein
VRWIWKKRRISPLWRGFLGASATIAFFGLCLFPALSQLASKPSAGLLRSIAQIGGALLIAWTIQTALVIRESHYRDPVQESTLGALMGSTACGLLGIVVSLGLSERAEVGHWTWVDRLVFSLAASSLFFLGICVGLLAYITYEWSRQGRIDPPE